MIIHVYDDDTTNMIHMYYNDSINMVHTSTCNEHNHNTHVDMSTTIILLPTEGNSLPTEKGFDRTNL